MQRLGRLLLLAVLLTAVAGLPLNWKTQHEHFKTMGSHASHPAFTTIRRSLPSQWSSIAEVQASVEWRDGPHTCHVPDADAVPAQCGKVTHTTLPYSQEQFALLDGLFAHNLGAADTSDACAAATSALMCAAAFPDCTGMPRLPCPELCDAYQSACGQEISGICNRFAHHCTM